MNFLKEYKEEIELWAHVFLLCACVLGGILVFKLWSLIL